MSTLQDKVVLITGALGQLGASAVPMFLEKGAVVAACDRRSPDELRFVRELRDAYGEERFYFIQADLNEAAQAESVIAAIERRFGRLDGTYHNTYTNIAKPVREQSPEEWEQSVRGTLTSAFLVCKYALPLMIRSGGGSIVNTSSILGQVPKPGNAAYGAAKAGLNQLTRVIAVENASFGIRANVVVPGDFKSDERLARMSEQAKETIRRETLLARSGRADEINEVAAFLLSDAASYITASLYTVDGGFHL